MKILKKCGGELEHAIKFRCVEPCSSEDYINSMKDRITRERIHKTWTRNPMESKMISKISREEKRPERPERPVSKCHKCGRASSLANNFTKKAKIIEEVQFDEEKEESYHYSAFSEDTPIEEYPIEKITAFFKVTEVHTHLPQ
ncbi:hypothetical protein O181_059308 [Austropuccinia psidii MF-1]|uniref:Uncharacterized protein n=1 Tax=Austropuccinia psidii MF-1 TaxID=1389203 RepID=A0A9Q3HWE0_9BASI|nr:hypothetical protein [Austropuccinia psidii MF-1]